MKEEMEAVETPSLDRCCICNQKIATGGRLEVRPTGKEGAVEKWFYCVPCWNEMHRLRMQDAGVRRSPQIQSTLDLRHWPAGGPMVDEPTTKKNRAA